MVAIIRAGWAICGLVVMACGSGALDQDGPSPGSPAGTKSILPDESSATGGMGGSREVSQADLGGEGGMAGVTAEGGYAGVTAEGGYGGERHVCGGYGENYVVRCTERDVFVDAYDADPDDVCAMARAQVSEAAGGAATGGAAAGGAGAGVAGSDEIDPGRCATYQAPPRVYHPDVTICIAYTDESRIGECTLGGECCVVVKVGGPGP